MSNNDNRFWANFLQQNFNYPFVDVEASSPATPPPAFFSNPSSQHSINLEDTMSFKPSEQLKQAVGPSKFKSKATKKEPNINYNEDEIIWLASVWCDISSDLIVNNRQKDETYWNRIAQRYNSGKPAYRLTRIASQLRCRWGRVMLKLQLFSDDFTSILKNNIQAATTLETYTTKQTSCLSKRPPHIQFSSAVGGSDASVKRAKVREDGSYSTSAISTTVSDHDESPIGIKATEREKVSKQSQATQPPSASIHIDEGFAKMSFLVDKFDKYADKAYKIITRNTSDMDLDALKYHLKTYKRIKKQYLEFAD